MKTNDDTPFKEYPLRGPSEADILLLASVIETGYTPVAILGVKPDQDQTPCRLVIDPDADERQRQMIGRALVRMGQDLIDGKSKEGYFKV